MKSPAILTKPRHGEEDEGRRSDLKAGLPRSLRSLAMAVLCFIAMTPCFLSTAYANNIKVTNLQLLNMSQGLTPDIQFDISWDNSWRYETFFYDAAWVFAKVSVNDGPWIHATILSVTSAGAGTGLAIDLSKGIGGTPDGKGVFLYRSASGIGTLSTTAVKLQWNRSWDVVPDTAAKVKIQVFAIEMVHIPQDSFYVGSGGTESGSFTDGSWTSGATIPLKVTSEGALTIGTGAGNLWGTSTSGPNTIGTAGTLPLAFPKGFQSFYIMKYGITQGQYRDFLNTLTRTQQDTRTATSLASGTTTVTNRYVMSNSSTVSNRNGVRCDATIHATNPIIFYCDLDGDGIPNESTDGEFIACNYLRWADQCAYADWAALRPMTELEFEKAARGSKAALAGEYSWGTTAIFPATGISNAGADNEIATTGGNCVYGAQPSVQGPLRSGFAATPSTTTREESGASFYGVMELSGNLLERPVTVGDATAGRIFDGVHGDGTLNGAGDANVTHWPGTNAVGSGHRGGHYGLNASFECVSDRAKAAETVTSADGSYGGRLVRTQ